MASKYPQDAGQDQANPQGQQRGKECQTCDTYQRDVTLPRLSTPLQLKKGPDKDKIISTFLNAMNALLNKGEGCVFFHIDDPNLVGFFDEAVDDKLKLLIPNDFLFHQVFERTHIDKNHVVFRVRSTKRPFISTLSFNSKVSLDRGLDDPTHAQMRRWIEEGSLSLQTSVQNTIASKLTFKKGKEVMVRNDGGSEVPFQESVEMQAKQFEPKPETMLETDWFMNVKEFLWAKSRPYITAFSKLQTGGSVFFGLREEKLEGVTGKFVCDGIKLSENKRADVDKTIRNKIKTEMAWLIHDCPKGWNPEHAVSVVFHAVTANEPDLCVVEIAVKSVRGVSFYDKQPVAYKLTSRGSPQPVTFEEWAKRQELPLPVPGTERVDLIEAQNPPLY
ncbi:hypothetical protein BaRGS_00025307 [Batillaria attramentaria]|uniref:Schlafen AlbA-2 domain-containing protein n=1 Tax=Batillaria attramentaria TaxID=370345 RepID=A0ABD0K8V6_9CAEN